MSDRSALLRIDAHATRNLSASMTFEARTQLKDLREGIRAELGPTSRPDWATYFLGIAHTVSLRAACTRRRVGAVIADNTTHRLISTGYNGTPSGTTHCTDGGCPRGKFTHAELPTRISYVAGSGLCTAIHAEANAVARALDNPAFNLWDATCYVTCEPCYDCHTLLARHRVSVIWEGMKP